MAGYGVLLMVTTVQRHLNRDVALARRLRASGASRKYLKQARKLLSKGNTHDFYAALARSILEYIANKLNCSAEGLTILLIQERLNTRSVSPETLGLIKTVLDECDLVRFAPSTVTPAMM